jgi:hypothetical protein
LLSSTSEESLPEFIDGIAFTFLLGTYSKKDLHVLRLYIEILEANLKEYYSLRTYRLPIRNLGYKMQYIRNFAVVADYIEVSL